LNAKPLTNPLANCDFGQKQPNAFGLYDMVGNAWQWTADWYGDKYYQAGERRDPTGPLGGTHRVLRGGSWSDVPKIVRASYRDWAKPDGRRNNVGFRCVGE
jgi:formylglycine-generating enzyme required for sulfatase activity